MNSAITNTSLPWLARLPAGLFALPLGLFGLAGAWRKTGLFGWEVSGPVSVGIGSFALGLLLLLAALYLLKLLRYPQAVRNEFNHQVMGPLMALIPLSTLLCVVFWGEAGHSGWLLLTLAALALQGLVALPIVSKLATGNQKALALTPALYMPPVGGGFVGAMAMNAIGFPGWGALFFGMGLASWALLEARILNRLFEGPLPMPVRPTIGIELAPPALATLAAGALWPQIPGEVLIVGLGIAAGPIVAVLARYQWWSQVPFTAGFWSFSFPVAALASGVIEVVLRGQWPHWVGGIALALACAIFTFLIVRTLLLLASGKLIPPAAPPAPSPSPVPPAGP